MWITIATQTYRGTKISRAFLKERKRQATYLKRELEGLGWHDVRNFEVDKVMMETLRVQFDD